jgi:hypothetical protein
VGVAPVEPLFPPGCVLGVPTATAFPGASAPAGLGGAPAAGVAAAAASHAAAASVGVTEPDGAVAAAVCKLTVPFTAPLVVAGAVDARSATIANIVVALSPVARMRLAAAGRGFRERPDTTTPSPHDKC